MSNKLTPTRRIWYGIVALCCVSLCYRAMSILWQEDKLLASWVGLTIILWPLCEYAEQANFGIAREDRA